MKGKNKFTQKEINELRTLINQRIRAGRAQQKSIRAKMRTIGFYGRDDFGITDMQPHHLDQLINSGRIIIIGAGSITAESIVEINTNKKNKHNESGAKKVQLLENFIPFDPVSGYEINLPNSPGNYLICLNKGSKLPDIGAPFTTVKFKGLEVIYTGIAGGSLRKRDYNQHFLGDNAGRSTLRKSIGSMFGYSKVPRDKDPYNGKTKFNPKDESKLSAWMVSNLTLFFIVNHKPDSYENELIDKFNPPLNLAKNKNLINKAFRKQLSELRKIM